MLIIILSFVDIQFLIPPDYEGGSVITDSTFYLSIYRQEIINHWSQYITHISRRWSRYDGCLTFFVGRYVCSMDECTSTWAQGIFTEALNLQNIGGVVGISFHSKNEILFWIQNKLCDWGICVQYECIYV